MYDTYLLAWLLRCWTHPAILGSSLADTYLGGIANGVRPKLLPRTRNIFVYMSTHPSYYDEEADDVKNCHASWRRSIVV